MQKQRQIPDEFLSPTSPLSICPGPGPELDRSPGSCSASSSGSTGLTVTARLQHPASTASTDYDESPLGILVNIKISPLNRDVKCLEFDQLGGSVRLYTICIPATASFLTSHFETAVLFYTTSSVAAKHHWSFLNWWSFQGALCLVLYIKGEICWVQASLQTIRDTLETVCSKIHFALFLFPSSNS